MKRLIGLLFTLLSGNFLAAQSFPVDTIQWSGSTEKRINFVYIGDGYTAAEQNKFIQDVIKLNEAFFNTVPFSNYRNYFNVFAIKVESSQSGIKHANTASDCPGGSSFQPTANPNNYFGTRFDVSGIHRLVAPQNYARINSVMAANFPEYDQILIVANSPFYGGSGGTAATSTTHSSAGEIMIHEVGHSFAALADEYWAGGIYAFERPNMTQQSNPALVKWKNWIGAPGIGVFQHTGFPWYKPANGTCKMEALNREFCQVCREAFVSRIFALVKPVQSFSPSAGGTLVLDTSLTFKLELLQPIPNTLRRTWTVNGEWAASNIDSLLLRKETAPAGTFIVRATVLDTTAFTRMDNHVSLNTTNIIWNINVGTRTLSTDLFNASLRIFPNPFATDLILQYETEKEASISVELTALDGKSYLLLPEEFHRAGNYTRSISPEDLNLAPGMYFVVFKIDSEIIAREVFKMQ